MPYQNNTEIHLEPNGLARIQYNGFQWGEKTHNWWKFDLLVIIYLSNPNKSKELGMLWIIDVKY